MTSEGGLEPFHSIVAFRSAKGRTFAERKTTHVRKLGLDVEALGELMAIIGLFNMTNAIADGYQVEPDVLPRQD